MPTSKFYQSTVDDDLGNAQSARNQESDAEALLVTRTIKASLDSVRKIGQVFTTSERAVMHGVAIVTNQEDSEHKQWGMYNLDGLSLREIFDRMNSDENNEDIPHSTLRQRIDIILFASNAITYANEHEIIHNDLRPEHIIINNRGDIAVIEPKKTEENVALEANEENIDPSYYSPEQARGEKNDALSDVYSLGLILFEALTLRKACSAETRKGLWENKRQGVRAHFTADEQKSIPPALIAITQKALDTNPHRRYACAEALRDDLNHYCLDQKVYAYTNEPIFDRLGRSFRHNTGSYILSFFLMLAVLGLALFMYQKHQEETSNWHTVLHETFSDDTVESLAQDWQLLNWPLWNRNNGIEIDFKDSEIIQLIDGALFVDTSKRRGGPFNLIYRHRIPGNVRISWDATPMRQQANLNCFFSGEDRWNGYAFHLASSGSSVRCEITRKLETLIIKNLDEPFQTGREYKFMMERIDNHIRFFINQQLFFEVEDTLGLNGNKHQQFGFEQTNNRVRFDNIQVWQQPLPEKVPQIEVAHALANNDNIEAALVQYQSIANAAQHEATRITAEYHAALSLMQLERYDAAIAALLKFINERKTHKLILHARALLCESYFQINAISDAEAQLEIISNTVTAPEQLKLRCLRLVVDHYSHGLDLYSLHHRVGGIEIVQKLLTQIERWEKRLNVPGSNIRNINRCLDFLINQGFYEEILERFPQYEQHCGEALLRMRQAERALKEYGHLDKIATSAFIALEQYDKYLHKANYVTNGYIRSLLALSRYSAIRRLPTYNNHTEALIQIASGNYDKALQFDPENPDALLALNKLDQIPDKHTTVKYNSAFEEVMMRRGQTVELLKRNRKSTHTYFLACNLRALELIKAGKQAEAKKWLTEAETVPYTIHGQEFARYVLPNLFRYWLDNDKDALLAKIKARSEDPRIKYSMVIDKEKVIVAGGDYKPYTTHIPTDRELAWNQSMLLAFHHDVQKNTKEALTHYRQTLKIMPPHAAILYQKICQWRVSVLEQ